MKKFLLSLSAVTALAAAAAPAAAQDWRGGDGYRDSYQGRDGYRGGDGYQGRYDHRAGYQTGRVERARQQVLAAARQDRIPPAQTGMLLDELRRIQPMAWRVDNGRPRGDDYAILSRYLGHVQAALNIAWRRGPSDRDYGYGYGDGRRGDWRR